LQYAADTDVSDTDRQYIVLGQINGLHGVKGWVKVFSHTEPRENILKYRTWFLKRGSVWQPCKVLSGRRQGKTVVVQLEGINDRDQAAALLGTDIAITRDQLPPPAANEYYWTDLEGLQVSNLAGEELGTVSHLFSTGANDVMVVQGAKEHLIPFVQGEYIQSIDLEQGRIEVDWDSEF
jgi:16S rRNA processing protein RimM